MSQQHSGQVVRKASEGVLRVLFGVFLAVWPSRDVVRAWRFAAVTVGVMLFAGREWHRMVRSPVQREIADPQAIHIQTAITVAAIACAVAALVLRVVPALLPGDRGHGRGPLSGR